MHFSVNELSVLCFELGVDYDNLEGSDFYRKAQELIEYMERRGKVEQLKDRILSKRPFLDLD